VKVGDRIKIRTEDGKKWWGRVTQIDSTAEVRDVTMGGLFPGGPPPDPYRKAAPGRTDTTLTVVLEGPR
jgi:hypothetical protein